MTWALIALGAGLWAAALALAESVAAPARAFGDPTPAPRGPVPLVRAFFISRLALIALAGVAAGSAIGWWRLEVTQAAGGLGLTVLLGYLTGEAVPKGLGYLAPDLAALMVPLARATLFPFRPLISLVVWLDRVAHQAFPRRRPPAGELGEPQQEMLAGVHSLAETTVADIMTPRLDISGLDAGVTWNELVDQVRREDHSRLPVYRDSLDDLVGLLHVKDLAPRVAGTTPPPDDWHQLLRPVRYVPEAKSLTAQLRDFQRGTAHLAVVVDEYGGTSGLITLEDILEEIVGEIHDEHDLPEAPQVEREGDGRFWVDGRLPLEELSAVLGSTWEHDDVATVSGLIYAELGRVPRPGEELRIRDFRVVVEQVIRRRIHRVYFERQDVHDAPAAASEVEEAG